VGLGNARTDDTDLEDKIEPPGGGGGNGSHAEMPNRANSAHSAIIIFDSIFSLAGNSPSRILASLEYTRIISGMGNDAKKMRSAFAERIHLII
jgi:hypothetical protein